MLSKKKKINFLIVPTHWRWPQIFVASSCLCGWELGGGEEHIAFAFSFSEKKENATDVVWS
jgi:hypothetical protein